jgi:hypothetical protein
MLLIEFEQNLTDKLNLLKYRNVDDDNWYYLYIDIETLNLLLINFGIISTKRLPTQNICIDNYSTSKHINITFCGASIKLYCGNSTYINLSILEQNY